MKYKIIDEQGAGMRQGIIFNSSEEVRESLVSFHSQDVEGVEKMTLEDICEMGCWRIEKVCDCIDTQVCVKCADFPLI